jgi:hypothetical protein
MEFMEKVLDENWIMGTILNDLIRLVPDISPNTFELSTRVFMLIHAV